jgi:uncharacterized membrane protein YbhN (UPF0104 family)
MELLKFVGLMVILILFISGILGFSLLKTYDEFRKAIETKNRIRLWLSFSCATLILIGVVIGFSGVGSSIGKGGHLTSKISLKQAQQNLVASEGEK